MDGHSRGGRASAPRTPHLCVRPQRLHEAPYPLAQALRLPAIGAGGLVRRARAVLARRGALDVLGRRRALILGAALPPGAGRRPR